MSDFNEGGPSSADHVRADAALTTSKVTEAAAAVERLAGTAGRTGARVYRRSNAAVAAYVDPLPGLLLAAAAGFAAGCLWSGRDGR